jgi:hypothetical protein
MSIGQFWSFYWFKKCLWNLDAKIAEKNGLGYSEESSTLLLCGGTFVRAQVFVWISTFTCLELFRILKNLELKLEKYSNNKKYIF